MRLRRKQLATTPHQLKLLSCLHTVFITGGNCALRPQLVVNMFIPALKLGILTWESVEINHRLCNRWTQPLWCHPLVLDYPFKALAPRYRLMLASCTHNLHGCKANTFRSVNECLHANKILEFHSPQLKIEQVVDNYAPSFTVTFRRFSNHVQCQKILCPWTHSLLSLVKEHTASYIMYQIIQLKMLQKPGRA